MNEKLKRVWSHTGEKLRYWLCILSSSSPRHWRLSKPIISSSLINRHSLAEHLDHQIFSRCVVLHNAKLDSKCILEVRGKVFCTVAVEKEANAQRAGRDQQLQPTLSLSPAPFPRLQVCTSERRRDKEPVLLEGHVTGASEQHKPSTALDCFPSTHLGVAARSCGPDTGWGRRPQTPALNATPAHLRLPLRRLLSPGPSLPCLQCCSWTTL